MSSTARFFVPPDAISGDRVILPPDDAHHARSVLRLRAGEPIFVHDGRNSVYHCTLDDVSARCVVARVEQITPAATEPQTRVTVAQALPKTTDKVEQVLQHGTEVGAAGFVLWGAFRSVAKLGAGDKIDKRLERWRGIVKGAAEQSGRGVLPDVAWAANGRAVAEIASTVDAALVAHEAAVRPLANALLGLPANATRLLVIVGPGGGLTDDEVTRFEQASAASVSLGPRVLRTETAALVTVAQILFAREPA
jgi:16S rRNA (uracil1498-N3)-methyltransferase